MGGGEKGVRKGPLEERWPGADEVTGFCAWRSLYLPQTGVEEGHPDWSGVASPAPGSFCKGRKERVLF